jgi:phosphoribosylglycinamide formyltransferase-1
VSNSKLALGALISGSGTNLQAILEAIAAGRLDAEMRVVVSNRPQAKGLDHAREHGIPVEIVDHKAFASREDFDRRVIEVLRGAGVELVCLAGFDRLISPVFVDAFRDLILNIHPALLPAFPGLHAQRQALEYGVKLAGATVHFVDEKTDHGPIVIQAAVPVLDGDTEESLGARILAEEHRIYPEAIRLFAAGKLRIDARHVRTDPAAAGSGAITNPRTDRR